MVYKNLGINFFLSGLKMLIKVSMVALGMVNFYLTRKSRKNPVMMKLKFIVATSLRLFQMTLQLFHLTLKLYRRRILVSTICYTWLLHSGKALCYLMEQPAIRIRSGIISDNHCILLGKWDANETIIMLFPLVSFCFE